ncbi:MAG: hypothetical protein GX797_05695 [Chloroflexi bacterium]|nr:hypothetical protein [Chloroflexota bacterium]
MSTESRRIYQKFALVPDSQFVLVMIAFAIGMAVRLVSLGATLFTGNEVSLAYQALQVSRHLAVSSSAVPAYTGLTSLLFFLFEPSGLAARLLPVVVGASLVVIPWFWKDRLGTRASLILSFALALDPTFVVFSRAINGGSLALAGILWGLTFLRIKKPASAGIAVGMGFLGGVNFWNYLVLIAIIQLVARLIEPSFSLREYFEMESKSVNWAAAAVAFVITIALVSTSFLLDPAGLGGAGSGILGYFKQFSEPFEKPIYHSIYLIFAHSFLPMVLFLLGLIKARGTNTQSAYSILGISAVVSVGFSIIVSRSSFELLLFPTLLFWVGGAIWLGGFVFEESERNLATIGNSLFIFALLIFISHNLRRLAPLQVSSPQFVNFSLMIIAGIVLLVLSWWLVSFSLTKPKSSQVLLVTLLLFLAVLNLSSVFRGVKVDQAFRWNEYLGSQVLLPNQNIGQIQAEFALAGKSPAQLGSYDIAELPEALGWYFSNFAIERNEETPSMVLTRSSEMPAAQVELRGMNVVLERSVNWFSNAPANYLRLLIGAKPQFVAQNAVLWVKTNLFTGANQ